MSDPNATPEQKQQALIVAATGLEGGGTGGLPNANRARAIAADLAANPDLTAGSGTASRAARLGQNAPEAPIGNEPFTRTPEGMIVPVQQHAAADSSIQGLLAMAKQRGIDTSAVEAEFARMNQLPEVQAVREAASPPAHVNPADNGLPPPPSQPPTPPISTNPEDFNANVQGAIKQAATNQPGNFWQVLNAFHSGNVIMGPFTLAKVAVNTAFSPAWNFGTQSARDLLTLNLNRVGGRTVGAQQALVNIGSDFADGFGRAMEGRVTAANPIVDAFLAGQKVVGGAAHAGLQNVSAEAVRRMELGAAAGEQVASQGTRGVPALSAIADLIQNPAGLSANAVVRANDLGARAGLRAPAGATQQTVQRMLNAAAGGPGGAVTNFLLPVFRIGAQAAARGIEATPIGLAGTAFDVARAGIGKGPYAGGFSQYGQAVTPLADRLTNNLVGTALTAYFASKSLDGTITGTGPDDPAVRADMEAAGWRPQSVLVPGVGYVSYARLPEQLRMPLALAGEFGDASRAGQGDPTKTAGALAQGVGKTLMQGLPGLQTLGDVGGILKGDPYAVGYLVGGGAAGYIPGSALWGNLAQMADPQSRAIPTTQGFGPAIAANVQQNIPGLRQQMQPRNNVLGQPVPSVTSGLQGLLPARTPGEVAPGTPGVAAIGVLNQAGMTLRGAPKSLSLKGVPIALTPDEQQTYAQVRAQLLAQTLDPLSKDAAFAAAPVAVRQQKLTQVMGKIDAAAAKQVLGSMSGADLNQRYLAGAQQSATQRATTATSAALP